VLESDFDAARQQAMDLTVGAGGVHGGTIAEQLFDREVDRPDRCGGVEGLERGAQAWNERDFAGGGPAEGARRAEGLVVGGCCLPSERLQDVGGSLLNEGLFRVGVCGHGSTSTGSWPERRRGRRSSRVLRRTWI